MVLSNIVYKDYWPISFSEDYLYKKLYTLSEITTPTAANFVASLDRY
jgi:hypothetical protein